MCFNGFYRIEGTLLFFYFWSKQEKSLGEKKLGLLVKI